jgi:hypothetical protein
MLPYLSQSSELSHKVTDRDLELTEPLSQRLPRRCEVWPEAGVLVLPGPDLGYIYLAGCLPPGTL